MRILLLAALAAGCGDGLAPTGYRGEELLLIDEHFNGDLSVLRLPERMRVGLFWSPAPARYLPEEAREQVSTGISDDVPTTYVIQVFEPLPAALRFEGGRWGLGREVIYADADGDGWRDADEAILGARPRHAVLFAARALTAAESPSGLPVPAGYHKITLPMGHVTPDSVSDGDCGVPVGAPCTQAEQCGRGACYLLLGSSLPGGMCLKEMTADDPCVPAGTRVIPALGNVGPRLGVQGWALPACAAHADCPRDEYACDFGQGVCRSFEQIAPINQDPALPFLGEQFEPTANVPARKVPPRP